MQTIAIPIEQITEEDHIALTRSEAQILVDVFFDNMEGGLPGIRLDNPKAYEVGSGLKKFLGLK